MCLLSFSAVSATDNATIDDDIKQTDEVLVAVENDTAIGTFTQLSELIDNASEGAVLELDKDYKYSGGSNEVIVIEKPVTIDGKGHILDGNNSSRIFRISSSDVTLKNITFQNAYSKENGGGLLFSNATNCLITDSNFINCRAEDNGGAICAESYSSDINISKCSFTNNYAWNGGAVQTTYSTISFSSVSFIANSAYAGAGVFLRYSIGSFRNCEFNNNTAQRAGGAFVSLYAISSAEGCKFIDNAVNGKYPFGGAVAYLNYEQNISSSIFKNNSINGEYGYGSSIFNYAIANIADCQFIDNTQNTANLINESIYTINGKVNGEDNIFENNTCLGNESLIYTMFWPMVFDKIFDENVTIPATLDLRTINGSDTSSEDLFNPIKNQGTSSACWTFAANSILEAYLKMHDNETWVFSENNMKNIMSCYGVDGWAYGPAYGGGTPKVLAYWARWSGPVREEDDPFYDKSTISPTNLTGVKHVQDVVYLPVCDNTQLKLAILNYGPVVIGYRYVTPEVSYRNGSYVESMDSPITLLPRFSNHLVSIVGWDDNYPGSRFGEDIGDGAFLIRNSFGTDFFDRDVNDTVILEGDGYNWISYYDLTLSKENIAYAIVNVEDADNYNHNYQHDPTGSLVNLGFNNDYAWFANQFTSLDDSQLAAFSLYTFTVNSTYEAYVYVNDKLAYSQNGSIRNPGYNTVKLNRLIQLYGNDTFKVVIKLTTPGFKYPIAIETTVEDWIDNVSAKPNQSFISPDGLNWHDISQPTMTLFKDWGMALGYRNMSEANVCLKVFTVKSATVIIAKSVATVYNGGKYLTVTLKDSNNNAMANKKITIKLNGVTKKLTTNSKGQVKLTTDNLGPKTYTAAITFGGDACHAKATKSVKVTVKKANIKMFAKAKKFKKTLKTKKYTVTLKSNQNKVMKNTKVILKVNKKTYCAKTNKKGQATFKLTKLTKKDKYIAFIKYGGNKYYNAKTKKAKLIIK